MVAPDILWRGVNMLPAGAVLGDVDYWTDFSQPADTAIAIEWIERQIGKEDQSPWTRGIKLGLNQDYICVLCTDIIDPLCFYWLIFV